MNSQERCTSIDGEASLSFRQRRVVFIHNDYLMLLCSKIPNVENRASIVYSLIKSYNLFSSMKVINVTPASVEDLSKFHSPLYIEFLKKISYYFTDVPEEDRDVVAEELEAECQDFGIGYDCPLVSNLFSLASLVGGSSLTAARQLSKRSADIVINWYGGWHHAQRENAEGFCYVNDVVLAIEELRLTYDRVLYVDLDIHHELAYVWVYASAGTILEKCSSNLEPNLIRLISQRLCLPPSKNQTYERFTENNETSSESDNGNGVENAYNFSRKVFTVSFHKYESGFYPGSGSLTDIGIGKGKYYTINVPLKAGMSDDSYCYVFRRVMSEVMKSYQPNAIIMQCGADGLAGDKLGGFNLTVKSYAYCVKYILSLCKPTLLLGGGGYNKANVARCWTYLTSIVAGCVISNNIPDNEYFSYFGSDFTLEVHPSNLRNTNTSEYLEKILNEITDGVRNNVNIN